ncbi:hypothetical protein, partial [Acinetobacter baumannii]
LALGKALIIGTAGLPHIQKQFYTEKDAKEPRKSQDLATRNNKNKKKANTRQKNKKEQKTTNRKTKTK